MADECPERTSRTSTHESSAGSGSSAPRHDLLSSEFRKSYQWLKTRIRRRVDSPADAEDVAASAFVEMAEMPETTVIHQPRALLTTIAQRLIFEMWRRRDLERAYLDALRQNPEAVTLSAEAMLELTHALVAVDRVLAGLSVNARRAFLYSHLDGLTYAEIAALLGVSVSMVRKYMAKALTQCLTTD